MSIRDRMTADEQIRTCRIRQTTEKGRRIDRLFKRVCAKRSVDPVAAMIGSPLLMLELAKLEQQNLGELAMGWTVLQCAPLAEARVCRQLDRQSFQTYAPQIRQHDHVARLFPGYVFVRIVDQWYPLFSTGGVVRVLMSGDRPAHLADHIIAELEARQDKHGFVRLPRRRLHPGLPVRITAGAFFGHCGISQECTSNERIRILLDLLGRKVCVDLPESCLETIATSCVVN